jgi:hypothetical protein
MHAIYPVGGYGECDPLTSLRTIYVRSRVMHWCTNVSVADKVFPKLSLVVQMNYVEFYTSVPRAYINGGYRL